MKYVGIQTQIWRNDRNTVILLFLFSVILLAMGLMVIAGLGFIARRYVERRFEVDILDATVAELKQRMAHVAGLPQAYKESMVNLAVETEPVKFAKMKLEGERCKFWDEWADRLLEDTKPTPEEEQAKKEQAKK